MLSIELDDSFAAYLRQSMSQGIGEKIKAFAEGVKERGLFSQIASHAFNDGSEAARELLFNQKQLLKVAEQYLREKPWIAYFAATKHIFFLRSKGITTASFKEFRDKEYADEVEKYAESIAVTAEKQLDSATQEFLHELITLQQVEPLLDQAIAGLGMMSDIPYEERHLILYPTKESQSLVKALFNTDGARDMRKLGFSISSQFITAAAKALKQRPEDWALAPDETIGYLQQLKARRPLLEDTFLQ
jgi:hypothetical protein